MISDGRGILYICNVLIIPTFVTMHKTQDLPRVDYNNCTVNKNYKN